MLNISVLIIDEGRQELSAWDLPSQTPRWVLSLEAVPLARDLQYLGGHRVLAGFDRGYFELDSRDGRILKVVDRWTKVTSAQRLADGTTLLAGLDLEGRNGVVLLALDAADKAASVRLRQGNYVRLVRGLSDGFLLCMDDRIVETDEELVTRRELIAPGFRHAWMPHRYADGRTLVSGGYGAFMARFAPDGSLLSCFGGKDSLPERVVPNFYASFILQEDDILVANWLGHGPGNGHKGCQLLQFDAQDRLTDTWSAPGIISSAQGLLLLPADQ